MLKDWNIIHEMDNDDGSPTCYARKFDEQQWWVTQWPKSWKAETRVKNIDEPEIIEVKEFKNLKAAIRWVENNHQNFKNPYEEEEE